MRYKGRGIMQLTGNTKNDTAGSYENYMKKQAQKYDLINHPDLVATDIHLAVDSGGWEFAEDKKVSEWKDDTADSEIIKENKKWKRKNYAKALGKSLSEKALLLEEEEKLTLSDGITTYKYFYLISRMINGYSPKHTIQYPEFLHYREREQAFAKLKSWFKYDKAVCKGEKELDFSTEGRAPWMDIAVQEIIEHGGKHESLIDKRIRKYHKDGAGVSYNSKTAWCSSFICWCLENSNPKYESPHSAASRKFLTHSSMEPCEVFYGAVAVFSDCNSTGTSIYGTGHVAFVFGKLLDKDTYAILGGNQGSMITLSPNYKFHGKAFSTNRKKTSFKIFRGFYKPKGYVIKEEDKLTKNDEYATENDANKKLKQKTQDTSKGESSR
jgi:uncharacterized protein (TIGR02594 family)